MHKYDKAFWKKIFFSYRCCTSAHFYSWPFFHVEHTNSFTSVHIICLHHWWHSNGHPFYFASDFAFWNDLSANSDLSLNAFFFQNISALQITKHLAVALTAFLDIRLKAFIINVQHTVSRGCFLPFFFSQKSKSIWDKKVLLSREIEEIKSNRATGNDVNTGRIME